MIGVQCLSERRGPQKSARVCVNTLLNARNILGNTRDHVIEADKHGAQHTLVSVRTWCAQGLQDRIMDPNYGLIIYLRSRAMHGQVAGRGRVELVVMMAGLSLMRTLLARPNSEGLKNPKVSRNRNPFSLTGAGDWQSPESDLSDSIRPQKALYAGFWRWAHDILLNDWYHMIPTEIMDEWERVGKCRTVATLARIAAKVNTQSTVNKIFVLPHYEKYDCEESLDDEGTLTSEETLDGEEMVCFTPQRFEEVAARCIPNWRCWRRFEQFVADFKAALCFNDRQVEAAELVTVNRRQLETRIIHRLCEYPRWPGPPIKSGSLSLGVRRWGRARRVAGITAGTSSVLERLGNMKYADAVPDMRYDSEAAYAFRLWFTGASHIPCYSTRLYGPVKANQVTPNQWKNTLSKDRQMWAAEASDYVSCYTLVKSFFGHSANNNLPQKREVDEIVDELVKNETSSGSFSALVLTRAVIDYLLQEWTPPSTTPATPTYCATTALSSASLSSASLSSASLSSASLSSASLSSAAVPVRGTLNKRGGKVRVRWHMHGLESVARSLTLMSGNVPEEISELGVPFAISSTESPPLPLGALMWAYDVLKYDLLHLLPTVYLAKLQNYPTVVELATYATDKVFKGPKRSFRLVCYPQPLYGGCKEEEDDGCKEVKIEDFRSLVPAEIDQWVKKGKNTERRELRLPTPEQLPQGYTGIHWWANSILADCWSGANPLGSPGDMISQPVFFAMVYSHICECLRDDFYSPSD